MKNIKNIIIGFLIITISIVAIYSYRLVLKIDSLIIINDELIKPKTGYLHEFTDLRAIVTPLSCDTIKAGSFYSADIALGAGNLKGSRPIVVIADSIDINHNLVGVIDTIRTNQWYGTIQKKYNNSGKYILYGKYIFHDNNSLEVCLDFNISVIVE